MTDTDSISTTYGAVRARSLELCEPLAIEDYVVQPMDDASPPKWHLAHVTWFFETFLLKPYLDDYQPFHPDFEVLFNSYYNGVGEQFPRPRRGFLSRPTVAEIRDYRMYVDEAMQQLLARGETPASAEVWYRTLLGCNHEQQHQELMVTDLKYNLGNNPLYPAYTGAADETAPEVAPLRFAGYEGGIHAIGVDLKPSVDRSFCFDNESPRHDVLLRDFSLASRLVTNGEYLAFIEAGGYREPSLWLSDGFSWLRQSGTEAPLYWVRRDGAWYEYTLAGLAPLDLSLPVCHVSGYEADAFARWTGCRLPSEAEWEVAVSGSSTNGNFADLGRFHPAPAGGESQFFGDTWEWTSSSYGAYPGYRPLPGTLGEYNGKFMANQLVLRGGSCATPADHIRPTYRNFFYPPDRWQFTGIRLAADA